MTTYFIGCPSDATWTQTTAKTLRGAKRIALNTYQQAVGGKIQVAVKDDSYSNSYVEVSVKYGFDKWQDTGYFGKGE